jgi:hypothetical protein
VNKPGSIYRWNGRNDWTNIAGGAIMVSVGDASNIWIIGTDARPYVWMGTDWKLITTNPAPLKYISVSAGGTRLAALGTNGNIYASADKGGSWTQIPGNFDGYVSVNDKYIIAGNKSNSTLYIRYFNC